MYPQITSTWKEPYDITTLHSLFSVCNPYAGLSLEAGYRWSSGSDSELRVLSKSLIQLQCHPSLIRALVRMETKRSAPAQIQLRLRFSSDSLSIAQEDQWEKCLFDGGDGKIWGCEEGTACQLHGSLDRWSNGYCPERAACVIHQICWPRYLRSGGGGQGKWCCC